MTVNNSVIFKINPQYETLVPNHSPSDYQKLKQGIIDYGRIYTPIIVNKNGVILDGHHRYKIWVYELKRSVEEIPQPTVMDFPDELQEKLFVIRSNDDRRHMNTWQRLEQEITVVKPLLQEIARRNQKAGVKIETDTSVSNNTQVSIGRVNKQIGEHVGVGETIVNKAETIIQKGNSEQLQRLRDGKAKVSKIYDYITKSEKKLKLQSDLLAITASGRTGETLNESLFCGDFREQGQEKIKNESVDLIFTDPPYKTEDLPIYKYLIIFADRVLKPGGSLITFAGHYALPTIFEYCKSTTINYWWEICIKHNGAKAKMWKQKIWVYWKPLLWFVKGDKPNETTHNDMADLIESQRPEKLLHYKGWDQSTVEAEYIIKNLTVEHELVVDPFMGIGTTGIAALKLNREFIGVEIDQNTYNIAKNQINAKITL